jgi:hypothetical protein
MPDARPRPSPLADPSSWPSPIAGEPPRTSPVAATLPRPSAIAGGPPTPSAIAAALPLPRPVVGERPSASPVAAILPPPSPLGAAPLPAFTRERIARACRSVLERSGALGVLPTPLEAVQAAAGVRERLEIDRLPGAFATRDDLRARLLGALWFEERTLFVDPRQSQARRRFTEAHETVHLLCPWHASVLRLDTAAELFGELSRGVEAEANFGAGQLIFQGTAFADEARRHDRSLRTPFALAKAYGASRHAAAHHYVESNPDPLVLLVAGRWPGPDGCLPIWRSVESQSFRRHFARLPNLDTIAGPLAEAIDQARTSTDPKPATLLLTDRAGRLRQARAEVANNRHCHLILIHTHATQSTRCRRRSDR